MATAGLTVRRLTTFSTPNASTAPATIESRISSLGTVPVRATVPSDTSMTNDAGAEPVPGGFDVEGADDGGRVVGATATASSLLTTRTPSTLITTARADSACV